MIGVGVIGYGYWGPNLVRNFSESPETEVIARHGPQPRAPGWGAENATPLSSSRTDHRELLANPKIDAVAIATPVSTHFDLALERCGRASTSWSRSRSRPAPNRPCG